MVSDSSHALLIENEPHQIGTGEWLTRDLLLWR